MSAYRIIVGCGLALACVSMADAAPLMSLAQTAASAQARYRPTLPPGGLDLSTPLGGASGPKLSDLMGLADGALQPSTGMAVGGTMSRTIAAHLSDNLNSRDFAVPTDGSDAASALNAYRSSAAAPTFLDLEPGQYSATTAPQSGSPLPQIWISHGAIDNSGQPLIGVGPNNPDTFVSNYKGGLRIQRGNNYQNDEPLVHLYYHMGAAMDNSHANGNGSNAFKAECDQSSMTTYQPIYCTNIIMGQRGYGGYGLTAAANIFAIRPPDALADGKGPRNMLHALDLGVIDQTGTNGGPLYPMELDMYADGDDVSQRIMAMMLFQNFTSGVKAKASVGLLVGVNSDDARFGSIVQFDGHFDHAGIDLAGAKPNCTDDTNILTCPALIYMNGGTKLSFDAQNDTFEYMDMANHLFTTYVYNVKSSDINASGGVHFYRDVQMDGTFSAANGNATITPDGLFSAQSIYTNGESHFATSKSNYLDPDTGHTRDAKFGLNGIAWGGGALGDSLTIKDGGKLSLSTDGNSYLAYDPANHLIQIYSYGVHAANIAADASTDWLGSLTTEKGIYNRGDISSDTLTVRSIAKIAPLTKASILGMSSPAEGTIAYDGDDHVPVIYTGTHWYPMQLGAALQ